MKKVAINGFGRIGRGFFRAAHGREDIEIVAINDLTSPENLAYLLKYDSVYRMASFAVAAGDKSIVVDGRTIPVYAEREPGKLPWRDMGIDIVVEATGLFTEYAQTKVHLDAGAKRVVITAPSKEENPIGATVLMGVNEEALKTCTISSNGSCTTNASSPLIAILDEGVGMQAALLTTTHAYTATQAIVDSPVKGGDFRKGRAAALNIVPESTGATISVTKAYAPLAGKFDGVSLRVPVPAGSIADITFIAKRPTSVEEVNTILRTAAKTDRWKAVFAASDEQLVSSDIIGSPYGSIADLSLTRVVDGTLVKVCAWYDNEIGYVHTLVEHVAAVAKLG
jgi:glyceraldehyde 3-phosphate dehydrogenase